MWMNRSSSRSGLKRRWVLGAATLMLTTAASAAILLPNLFPFLDPTGVVATYNSGGPIDESARNPFFQSLGTNGRTCGTCHLAKDAFGLSGSSIRAVYAQSRGTDPLFAAVDGANCPQNASLDPQSHSLLLQNGLIRIPMQLPGNREFQIQVYRDPYGCAITTDPTTHVQTVSVYRRPLPTTNLRYLSAVMFDGRETVQPLTSSASFQSNLVTDLKHQATDATLIHAQAVSAPTADQQAAIVSFEMGLTSAQELDFRAGWLNHLGATGGPFALSRQGYYPGTNDSLGADPNGYSFNSTAMTLYAAFEETNGAGDLDRNWDNFAIRQIAAGEKLFGVGLRRTSVRAPRRPFPCWLTAGGIEPTS